VILDSLITLSIALLVFVPLEHAFAHRDHKILRRQFFSDAVYALLNSSVTKAGLVGVVVLAGLSLQWLVPDSLTTAVRSLPYWLQVVLIVVTADIVYYFAHRAFHKIPFLWRFHSVHHSIEEMDWMAAHRNHPVDLVLSRGTAFIPAVVLGFSDAAIGFFVLIFHWHVLMIHANLNIRLGPLSWLIASPRFHHWHHASDQAAHDKNFAAQLPVLDAIFGTLYMPSRMPDQYGIEDPVPSNCVEQMYYPFLSQDSKEIDDRTAADA
jgi:sterol desaturase/sphingolipid hydroxylase (fatty acid hydroxylase superfamily)